MKNFIELTESKGKSKVFINLANILYVQNDDVQAVLFTIAPDGVSLKAIYVTESYEEVKNIISGVTV